MQRSIIILAFAAATCSLHAQNSRTDIRYERLHHAEMNYLNNIYLDTDNPIQLSFNTVTSFLAADVSGEWQNGDFRAMDQSPRYGGLNVHIWGLQDFGRLKVSGDIEYINSSDKDHRWNNTMMVSPLNPFFVADSLPSDVTTDRFAMHAAASYHFSDRWTGALQLKYTTGSLADQSDPRPKTNAMRFNMKPGVLFQLNEKLSVGADASVELFRSDINFAIENPLNPYTYFVMKGMGDHLILNNSETGNRPRDYRGTTIGAAVQAVYQGSALSNTLQLAFTTNSENSIDGGQKFEYRTGDYRKSGLSLYDRVRYMRNDDAQHNLTLSASYLTDKGYWYDQQRKSDTEHGNRIYYEILNKSQIHSNSMLTARMAYSYDRFQQDRPRSKTGGSIQATHLSAEHYEADTNKQHYTVLTCQANRQQFWNLGKARVEGLLDVGYTLPLGTHYEDVRGKMADFYERPAFEYATASHLDIRVRGAYHHPVSINGQYAWFGLFAQVGTAVYTGQNETSPVFDGTSRTVVSTGVQLTF